MHSFHKSRRRIIRCTTGVGLVDIFWKKLVGELLVGLAARGGEVLWVWQRQESRREGRYVPGLGVTDETGAGRYFGRDLVFVCCCFTS